MMTNQQNIQSTLFTDFHNRDLYANALQYGLNYLDEVLERHVYPADEAIADLVVFDEPFPTGPTPATAVLNQLHQFGAPATVAQLGGRYFGFVDGSAAPAGLAAKALATFWDQNAAMHVLSPITSRLETVVENWLRQIFKLPRQTIAGFVSGSSLGTFCGLAAARYRLLQRQGWDVNERGLFGAPQIRVVTGRQAHSTVLKAIGLLGFGKATIEWVDVDAQGRIIPEAMPVLDEKTMVILQAGNVNSGAYDPFVEVCEKSRRSGAWVHIDGAFGLWAAAVPGMEHLTAGIELADSWSVDGHKTLNTPYDCGVILCADEEALVSALHMSGSYIIESEAKDGMFYTPEMSRRARVIELWATMKYLGRSGIAEMVHGMHARATQFKVELEAHGFEVLNDVVFNQVLVSCGDNALTLETLRNIQEARVCWLGGSEWLGRKVMRISVSSWATTAEDVTLTVQSFVDSREKAQQA